MITLQNICKSFSNKKNILNHFNLRIQDGETVAIIGQSGIGKSVLLKCILGLIPIDSGSIQYTGKISMVFQQSALFDSLSIWKNVAFYLLNHGSSYDCAQQHAKKALELVDLTWDIANSYPAEISGGMRRRVAIARALIMKPSILLFDEPTAGLDPITAHRMDSIIQNTCQTHHITAILVTHDMKSVQRISNRVVMLKEGKNFWEGKTSNLFQEKNPSVKQFIFGNLEENII